MYQSELNTVMLGNYLFQWFNLTCALFAIKSALTFSEFSIGKYHNQLKNVSFGAFNLGKCFNIFIAAVKTVTRDQ